MRKRERVEEKELGGIDDKELVESKGRRGGGFSVVYRFLGAHTSTTSMLEIK